MPDLTETSIILLSASKLHHERKPQMQIAKYDLIFQFCVTRLYTKYSRRQYVSFSRWVSRAPKLWPACHTGSVKELWVRGCAWPSSKPLSLWTCASMQPWGGACRVLPHSPHQIDALEPCAVGQLLHDCRLLSYIYWPSFHKQLEQSNNWSIILTLI